jgi:hypothetical protein
MRNRYYTFLSMKRPQGTRARIVLRLALVCILIIIQRAV